MKTQKYFNSEGKQIPEFLEPTSYFAYVDSIEEVKTGVDQGINLRLSCIEIRSLNLNLSQENLIELPVLTLNLKLSRELYLNSYSMNYLPFLDGRWLKLTTKFSREDQLSANYYGVPLINSGISYDSITPIRRLSRAERALYRELMKTLNIENLGREATEEDFQQLSESLKSFSHISVYDVGQGNLNGLCQEDNMPIAYFDMGGGSIQNAFTYPNALNICTKSTYVILSHWDLDHIQTALMTNQSHSFTWFVPQQNLGLNHFILAYYISQNGKLLKVKKSLKSQTFSILKCTGTTKNDAGLALLINLPQYLALLPGDASFSKIPNIRGIRFDALIATHHGSDHGLTYYRRNVIPTANSNNMLAFSYGTGNTFGHDPNIVINKYIQKGWAVNGNVFRETPNDKIKMKYSPVNHNVPCNNQRCDLNTVQCY